MNMGFFNMVDAENEEQLMYLMAVFDKKMEYENEPESLLVFE